MSLCSACRKALPNIPASRGNNDSIAATSEITSEHENWERLQYPDIREKWVLRGPFPLHTSWESLVISMSHGCPICWTLWRNIRPSPIASPSNERIKGFEAVITNVVFHAHLDEYSFHMWLIGHHLKKKEVEFSLWKTTERCYLKAEMEFPLAVQHTPKSAADAANRWIKTCEIDHSRCLKQAAPPEHTKMPTRLLDLGNANSNSWRLYQDPRHVPYAALSHRWSSDTPELLTSNYENYCNSQPDTALPQNYQEIVSICRAIPIQYLWIDSLCIIQNDNGHEFSKEAPLMTDIYHYAFLTLSICWDFLGCSIFRRCQPRSIPRPRPNGYEKHDCVSDSEEWVFVQQLGFKELQADVNKSPINKRAWVLQERCLSRRLLYLGNDQLYWECDGITGTEASPDPAYKVGERQSIYDLTGHDKDEAWSSILTQYTSSDLTFESDRLVAIAGLTKLIARKTGERYLAGIWLDSWMQTILWQPMKERDRSSKIKPGEPILVPPSWSWLGFSGSVASSTQGPKIPITSPNSFESAKHQPLALLSQAVVIPPTSDPFTSFERAILKIRCLLLPVTFAGDAHEIQGSWFSHHEYDVELCSMGLDCLRLRGTKPSDNVFITFRFHFNKPVDISLRYFLLPLYRSNRGGLCSMVSGLVLQKSLSERDEEYTRVGIWNEDHRYSSQLSPMISNTILKLGMWKKVTLNNGSLTEHERLFDLKLGQYAAGHVDSKALFPIKIVKRAVEHQSSIEKCDEKADLPVSEDTEQGAIEIQKEDKGPYIRHEEVECSLLPHFTTAEWGTISLV